MIRPQNGNSDRAGAKAEVLATYDDQINRSASAIIIAPGGVWPKKTKAQYTSGRMLGAFGFDSLHIGQQKLFKGKHFASTDQASVICAVQESYLKRNRLASRRCWFRCPKTTVRPRIATWIEAPVSAKSTLHLRGKNMHHVGGNSWLTESIIVAYLDARPSGQT